MTAGLVGVVAFLLPYRSRLNVERPRATIPEIERLGLAVVVATCLTAWDFVTILRAG